jgi:hypothetical protein
MEPQTAVHGEDHPIASFFKLSERRQYAYHACNISCRRRLRERWPARQLSPFR